MTIDKLSDKQFDEFFELVKSMVSEAEFKDAKPEQKIIWNVYKNPNVSIFIATKENKIIGFLAGVIGPYFFSTRKRVSDIGFYVLPEYRGSRVAIKLLAALENWAKDNNITDVCIGQTTAVNMEKTQQFYNRMGYKTVGFNTIKHLEK
jgi:GNAT superfamily N-acetyltransferase